MNKYEKLAKKLNISKDKEIFVPVYSEDLFVELGLGNRDEFYDLTCVEDIAFEYFENLQNTSLEKITFGVIDEEYFKYLEENSINDTVLNRQQYVKDLSDEKRKYLWHKNDYNFGYDFGILPIIVENTNYDAENNTDKTIYNFKLSKNSIKAIRKSILSTFNNFKEEGTEYHLLEKNIFISPYLIDLKEYTDENVVDKIFDFGISILNKDLFIPLKEFNFQTIDTCEPLDFFGILIMYRYEVPCTISRDYIRIAQGSPINAPNVDVDFIESILQNDIDVNFELLTINLIYPEAINAVIKDFISTIVQQVVEKMESYEDKMNTISGHCKKSEPKKNKKKKK